MTYMPFMGDGYGECYRERSTLACPNAMSEKSMSGSRLVECFVGKMKRVYSYEWAPLGTADRTFFPCWIPPVCGLEIWKLEILGVGSYFLPIC